MYYLVISMGDFVNTIPKTISVLFAFLSMFIIFLTHQSVTLALLHVSDEVRILA